MPRPRALHAVESLGAASDPGCLGEALAQRTYGSLGLRSQTSAQSAEGSARLTEVQPGGQVSRVVGRTGS
ncbi:hypothetical protein ACFXBB_31490 [Streptomyces scopuliridis]|uniref:hypothetical protein n=1 Tax=Streptomyces scopuliridis TaxID=452529 RepID=UPI003687D416